MTSPSRAAVGLFRACVPLIVAASLCAQSPPPNDEPAGAYVVGAGTTFFGPSFAPLTTVGATQTVGLPPGLFVVGANDVWFRFASAWSGPTTVDTCAFATQPGGIADSLLALYASSDGVAPTTLLTWADDVCGLHASVQFDAVYGAEYFVRVFSYPMTAPGTFALAVTPPPPPNDDPAAALPLTEGLNLAAGAVPYSNYGALDGTGYETCLTHSYTVDIGFPVTFTIDIEGDHDVFFAYAPTSTAWTTIATVAPPGLPAQPFGPVLEAYEGPARRACGGGAGLSTASIEFFAVAGATYLIRLSSYDHGDYGSFGLIVRRRPTLSIASPFGPGSLRVQVAGCAAYLPYNTFVTLNAGAFPNGWFFGVAPTMHEVALQLFTGVAPFAGVADGQGTATFDVAGGLPPLTLYAVTIVPDATAGFAATDPVAWTIP